MADTHEDPTRSDSSGSPTESKVEVGETPSRAEAFRALIARGLQSSDSRVSLETRLGVITITILVFTFGFLIYRKVDLHQQRLAAQIPPQVTPSEDEQVREALERPVTDLTFSGLDQPVADHGAFNADFGDMTEDDSPVESDRSIKADSPVEMVFEEPPIAASAPDNDLPPEFASNDRTPELPAFGDAPGESPFSEPVPAATEGGEPTAGVEPAFSMEPVTASEPVTDAEPVIASEPGNTSTPSTQPEPVSDSAFSAFSDSPAVPEKSIPEASAVGTPFSDEVVADRAPAESSPGGVAFEEPAVQEEPPIQIAMLDPKPQENPFGPTEPEFPAFGDPSPEPVQTPVSDPVAGSEPTLDFSAEPTPMPTTPALREVPDENPFGAEPPVIQKSGSNAFGGEPRSERTISPAVASGPDGKFSLAAFNYQNNVPAPIDDGNTYDIVTVQTGDNYSKISKRIYGTSRYFAALAVFNQHRISDPKKMRPGMKVLVPPADLLEERYPQLFQDAQAQRPRLAPGFFLDESGNPAYRVGARETLSEISERCLGRSSRWTEILRLNQHTVQDPNKLKPGTVLALPDDAVEVNVSPQ